MGHLKILSFKVIYLNSHSFKEIVIITKNYPIITNITQIIDSTLNHNFSFFYS